MAINPINMPFEEAINFFKNKIQLPSSGYADIVAEQHSHAFMVSGASHDALVEDFYNALYKAKTQGTGYPEFKKDFEAIAEKHGWAYNGSPGWRSKVIYHTNVTQAYNAGHYQQMMSVKHLRPYWQYIHTGSAHPRKTHLALNGQIYSADDPFWDYYMPQNGYGCNCKVRSLATFQAEREWSKAGKTGPDVAPEIEWEDVEIGKTGSNPRIVRTPKGIDPGFGYNPGKAWLEPHTVRPLEGYDAVLKQRDKPWPTTKEIPLLPTPTRVKPSILLPADTLPEVAVEDFLNNFGADMDTGAVFEDAVSVPVAITKALFQDGKGEFKWLSKPEKVDRLQYVNLMAMTIIEPDEIWWAWEQDFASSALDPTAPLRWRLKRRYLRSFELDGSGEYGISAFEWSSKGWTGSTAFMAEPSNDKARLKYFNKQRVGRLVYKKDGG